MSNAGPPAGPGVRYSLIEAAGHRTGGEGRAVAFASDRAPHWAPPEFVERVHYPALWGSILSRAAQART